MPFEYDDSHIMPDSASELRLADGFTRVPNEILESLCRIRIPGEERQVLDVIMRKTYGYAKNNDQISFSQFEAATGLDRGRVGRALRGLKSKRIISVNNDTGKITTYCINKRYSQWVVVSKPTLPTVNNDTTKTATHTTKTVTYCNHSEIPSNDAGSVNNDSSVDIVLQVVSIPTLTKERFTKERNTLVDSFDKLWLTYPKKDGKKAALKHYVATIKTAEDCQRIRQALDNYLAHLKATGTTLQFTKNGSTWFSNWQDWETPIQGSATTTPQRDRETEQQLEEYRRLGGKC